MSGDAEDPLLSAAADISDGVPVDWNQLERGALTADRAAVIAELRSLERVARATQRLPVTWGRFAIVAEIGRGVFGIVYHAFDPTLQIDVALKVAQPRDENESAAGKALDEIRRLVKVKHPNVVRAYGAERLGNEIGLSMELVKGDTLADIVRRQAPFSAREAAVIGIDLCQAVAAVHAAGMLHGDIKAHNVMREEGGRTVLMDFGAGRYLRQAPQSPGGDFAGTPLYLAPEVFAGRNRTVASDIYSLGVLLYFLVTGAYPVDGDTRTHIGRQHDLGGARRPLRDVRPDLPSDFIRVVEKAIEENPDGRYDSAGALEEALARTLAPERRAGVPALLSSPRWKIPATIAASILIAALAVLTLNRMRDTARANAQGATDPAAGGPSTPSVAVAPDSYRIEAAFYRERNGTLERLRPGATVATDDHLSMQVQVSAPTYVYVVNEDERGDSYLLFPLPGQGVLNPLTPGERHRLPGTVDGESISWAVTSTGEREHFLIVASPTRSTEFDELFATLPRPRFGKPLANARLTPRAMAVLLRSVGGLAVSAAQIDRQLRAMPEFSTALTDSEETARGIWLRHATFANPQ